MKNSFGYLLLAILTIAVSIVLTQTSITAKSITIPQQTYLISNQQITQPLSILGRFSAQDKNQDKSIDKNEIVDFNLNVEYADLKATCNLSELSDFKFSDFEEYIKRSSEVKKMARSRAWYEENQKLKQLRRSLKLTCQRQGLKISLSSESNLSNNLEIKINNSSLEQQRQSFDFIIDIEPIE
jgi:hypothetical protein